MQNRANIRKISLFALLALSPAYISSASELSLYFSNDSINGFKISDAYETHDMGIVYQSNNTFVDLNAAIVTPNMHIYRNQYREANRSYGELITLTIGQENQDSYLKITSISDHGLSNLQDQVHKILSLQPVAKINDIVRMPDALHAGFGGTMYTYQHEIFEVKADAYVGSDKATATLSLQHTNIFLSDSTYNIDCGTRLVAYDYIVSARPISAAHRKINPYCKMTLDVPINASTDLIVSEFVSLPTIASDTSLFLKLGVQLRFKF